VVLLVDALRYRRRPKDTWSDKKATQHRRDERDSLDLPFVTAMQPFGCHWRQ
jgi:hypothetical protein